MALFDIPFYNSAFEGMMKHWKEAADNLKPGDDVVFHHRERGFIVGTIKSFFNWCTVEVITSDGGKWSINVDWCEKIK